MRKTTKKILSLLCMVTVLTLLSGCGLFTRKSEIENYEVEVETDIYQLENGAFYVHHGDEFYKLYLGNATFGRGYTSDASYGNDRVAWFGKDWNKIPTMYKGDTIVYHYTDDFNETFGIERFEDTGFTVGICNLRKRPSGRFSFSANPTDAQINPQSDASKLYDLGAVNCVIERIGGADLRGGNVSRSGTIIGLKEGDTYRAELYVGTDVQHYELVADSRALCSMDTDKILDYEYMKATYIKIEFPEYLNSGYYFVGGYGFVRYIAGTTEYAEGMEMNLPNTMHVADYQENGFVASATPQEFISEQVKEEQFTIAVAQKATISVTYNEDIEYSQIVPTAKIIGNKGVFTLSPDGENRLSATVDLEIGDYTLEISGLAGRTYTYRIDRLDT